MVLAPVAERVDRDILVVDDENVARSSLKRLLERRGFDVRAADSPQAALLEARQGEAGVVIMDIVLRSDLDGIETAEKIRLERPLTSFIFVTAYSTNSEYRLRVRESAIRVGGWVQKPFDIEELVEKIEKEMSKLELLEATEQSRLRGIDPRVYLQVRQDLDPTLSAMVVKEVSDEIDELGHFDPPLAGRGAREDYRSEHESSVRERVEKVYEEMRHLIEQASEVADFESRMSLLRETLRSLQEEEADVLESRFVAQLKFDSGEAMETERRIRDLERKYE